MYFLKEDVDIYFIGIENHFWEKRVLENGFEGKILSSRLKNFTIIESLLLHLGMTRMGQFFITTWGLVVYNFYYTLNHVCYHYFHLVQCYSFQEKK